MSEDVREQSEFNMAVSYLNRLNTLFYACDESSIQLNMYDWFHSLMAVYRELSTEMKDDEIIRNDKTMQEINELLSKHVNNQQRGNKGIDADLVMKLHHFEIYLRKVLKSSGLQTKTKDDAAKALR